TLVEVFSSAGQGEERLHGRHQRMPADLADAAGDVGQIHQSDQMRRVFLAAVPANWILVPTQMRTGAGQDALAALDAPWVVGFGEELDGQVVHECGPCGSGKTFGFCAGRAWRI